MKEKQERDNLFQNLVNNSDESDNEVKLPPMNSLLLQPRTRRISKSISTDAFPKEITNQTQVSEEPILEKSKTATIQVVGGGDISSDDTSNSDDSSPNMIKKKTG